VKKKGKKEVGQGCLRLWGKMPMGGGSGRKKSQRELRKRVRASGNEIKRESNARLASTTSTGERVRLITNRVEWQRWSTSGGGRGCQEKEEENKEAKESVTW